MQMLHCDELKLPLRKSLQAMQLTNSSHIIDTKLEITYCYWLCINMSHFDSCKLPNTTLITARVFLNLPSDTEPVCSWKAITLHFWNYYFNLINVLKQWCMSVQNYGEKSFVNTGSISLKIITVSKNMHNTFTVLMQPSTLDTEIIFWKFR